MNPFTKNAVIAGAVSLVVALGVIFGARAFSPSDATTASPIKVFAPDGSVVGTTEPIKASSGPPVPACSINGTFLECQGVGVPFTWGTAGFGDGGLNEAFGALVPGLYEGGTASNLLLGKVATATITPALTGDLAATGSLAVCCTDSGTAGGSSLAIYYSVHGDASVLIPVSGVPMTNMPVGDAGLYEVNGSLGSALVLIEAGTTYDFYLLVAAPVTPGGLLIGDSSLPLGTMGTVTGGIWVHEFP